MARTRFRNRPASALRAAGLRHEPSEWANSRRALMSVVQRSGSLWNLRIRAGGQSRPLSPRARRRAGKAFRPHLEALEDRCVLSVGALLGTAENPTPANNDAFGKTVALSGNYLVAGAP